MPFFVLWLSFCFFSHFSLAAILKNKLLSFFWSHSLRHHTLFLLYSIFFYAPKLRNYILLTFLHFSFALLLLRRVECKLCWYVSANFYPFFFVSFALTNSAQFHLLPLQNASATSKSSASEERPTRTEPNTAARFIGNRCFTSVLPPFYRWLTFYNQPPRLLSHTLTHTLLSISIHADSTSFSCSIVDVVVDVAVVAYVFFLFYHSSSSNLFRYLF